MVLLVFSLRQVGLEQHSCSLDQPVGERGLGVGRAGQDFNNLKGRVAMDEVDKEEEEKV